MYFQSSWFSVIYSIGISRLLWLTVLTTIHTSVPTVFTVADSIISMTLLLKDLLLKLFKILLHHMQFFSPFETELTVPLYHYI